MAVGALLLFAFSAHLDDRAAPDDRLLWAVAAAAAVGAALAPGAPTGWAPLDALLRAGLAAAVTLAAGRTGRVPVLWAVTLAAVLVVVVPSPLGVLAAAGFGVLVAETATGTPSALLRAAAAGLAVQSLLRLDWPIVMGASALAALLALVPLLVAGHRTMTARHRRIVRRSVTGVAVYCLVGTGIGLFAAFSARSDIERGLEAGVSGLDAIGGDAGASQEQLRIASDAFGEASDGLSAFWVRPVYAVPFVAQQARAVRTMADAGADLSADALATLEVVDPATLSPRGGRIDLAAIASLGEPLDDATRSLAAAQRELADTDTPWLLGPLADKHAELSHEVDRAASTADVAADAADLIPAMLGADGPRRYLLVVQTPAESRGAGGFMGNWGEITAVDGVLALSRFGRIGELNDARGDPAAVTFTDQDAFLERYGIEVARTWGVNNFSPDFASVAEILAQLYPQSGGAPIDGVISVDPYGLAALLDAVGKVRVDGWPETLTKSNVAEVLLHEQYIAFDDGKGSDGKGDDEEGGGGKKDDEEPADEAAPEDDPGNAERKDFLGDTAEAVFDKLVDGGFDNPASLADALAPAVAGRHLQLVGMHEDEQALFEALGATGATPALRGDSVGIVGQNYSGNKIDWFLTRAATYDVEWDPATGRVDGDLTVELTNAAPATGLPDVVIGYGGAFGGQQTPTADGENLMLVSLHSAFPLRTLTLDGQPVAADRREEGGRFVYTAYVSLPAGATRTLHATMQGALPVGEPYTLDPVWQPMVTPDRLDVSVRVPAGWRFEDLEGFGETGDRTATAAWTLDEDRAGTAPAERAGSGLLRLIRGET